MPVSVFDEWFEHFLEEPFGYEVDVHKHAEVCTIMANGLFSPKAPYKCSDFHFPAKVPEPQTWEQMFKGMENLAGGKR